MFPTHNWIALFPIDNVGFRTIFYGYSNAFSIRPQIILYIYNFYLVLLVLMQYIYRLYSLYGIYGPMDSQSFVGSYPVNSLLFFCLFNFSVVAVNNLSHVLAVTTTYFQRTFVETFVQFVFFREMFRPSLRILYLNWL